MPAGKDIWTVDDDQSMVQRHGSHTCFTVYLLVESAHASQ